MEEREVIKAGESWSPNFILGYGGRPGYSNTSRGARSVEKTSSRRRAKSNVNRVCREQIVLPYREVGSAVAHVDAAAGP